MYFFHNIVLKYKVYIFEYLNIKLIFMYGLEVKQIMNLLSRLGLKQKYSKCKLF